MSTADTANFRREHEAEELQATSESTTWTDEAVCVRRNHRIANTECGARPTTAALPEKTDRLRHAPKPARYANALVVAQNIHAMDQSMGCTGRCARRQLKGVRRPDVGKRGDDQ